MLKRLWIFIVFISCSQPKPVEQDAVEEKIDSSSFLNTDTVVVAKRDTTYEKHIDNNPDSIQIDLSVAYVYNRNGIDLYEPRQGKNPEKVIGHLGYRSQVRLLNPLRNETPVTIDGIKGYWAVCRFENRMAYVFTGYLLNYPVSENADLLGHFIKVLHLERPVLVREIDTGDRTRPGEDEEYYFEQGIVIKHHVGYESDVIDVTIPGMTLQQAWLLWSNFSEAMQLYLPLMPTDSCTMQVSKDIKYQVEMKTGKVSNIIFSDDTSCSDYTTITADGKGARIFNGYGC